MRTNIVVSLTLLLTVVSASDANSTSSSGGSLEKLLARIAHRGEHRDNPDFIGNGTRVRHPGHGNHTHVGPRPFKPKTASAVAEASETAGTVPSAAADRIVKRVRKGNAEDANDNEKRYIWTNSIIQDDTPTSVIPIEGGGANTPTFVPVAPTFPPKPETVDSAAAIAAVSKAHSQGLRASLKAKQQKNKAEKASAATATPSAAKRWVWGTAIIQDDTPTSGVPAVGENVNLLNSYSADTPTATLVAPTFPALSAAASNVASVASVGAASVQSAVSVATEAVIGVVRNPIPTSSTTTRGLRQALSAVQASASASAAAHRAPLKNQGRANVPQNNAPKAVLPKTTSTKVSSTVKTTSTAKPKSKKSYEEEDEDEMSELDAEEELEYLDESEEVEEADLEKRYIWATSIIQDDTPTSGLPSVGANANLLSSGAASLATPTASVTIPTFAPENVNIIPVVLNAASSSASASSVVPTSTFNPIRNHRHPIGSHHNLVKKYIWANSIINDDTPASEVPPVGVNSNLLGNGIGADTPKVTLVAPTFPPLPTAAAESVVASVEALPSDIKVVPGVSSAAGVRLPITASSSSSSTKRAHRPISTAAVVNAMAQGNRMALSQATGASATAHAKKDNTPTVDTLRRLLKEKREAVEAEQ